MTKGQIVTTYTENKKRIEIHEKKEEGGKGNDQQGNETTRMTKRYKYH